MNGRAIWTLACIALPIFTLDLGAAGIALILWPIGAALL